MKTKKKNLIIQLLHDYRFNSILVRNFIMILLVLLCSFLGVMLLISVKLDQLIEKEVSTISSNSLRQTAERMDTVGKEVVQISAQLSLDDDIMEFLLTDTSDDSVDHKETLLAREKLDQYAGIFEYVDSIYIYSSKSNYLLTEEGGGNIGEFADLTWYNNLTERIYEPARMISRLKENKYPYLLTYILPVRLTQMQFLGGIIVNVDVEQLGEFVAAGTDENLLIIDERDNIIFSSAEEFRMKKWTQLDFYQDYTAREGESQTLKRKGDSVVLTMLGSSEFNWRYVSMVPLRKYQDYQKDLHDFILVIVLVLGILTVASAVFISIYSYEPVKNIISLLKNPDSYDVKQFSEFRNDEIHEIIQNIIHNFYSNNRLQDDLQEYLAITNRAQIIALQAQISPHFLYNTLENIRWKAFAICKGDNEVSQMILKLSELLRISLENEKQIISLREELDNAKLYIDILQLRYEDKLSVDWEIAEDLMACQIVKVSLQPLIENAVYHGIKPLRGKGCIVIRAWSWQDTIYLSVTDNGQGMTREECEKLNQDMADKYQQKSGHIGVRNVNQRLKLLMGERAGLHIDSEAAKGTTVTMYFPLCKM
ncbi:MAG: sensor histidine kinase [Lachnospiraceae bacterium]|nr:sensor histidine kinase [Lachnospiraceae bacterium]